MGQARIIITYWSIRRVFTAGLLLGWFWVMSVWLGGWLIFLYAPEAYDTLNDSIGLPMAEWWHDTVH